MNLLEQFQEEESRGERIVSVSYTTGSSSEWGVVLEKKSIEGTRKTTKMKI